MVKINVYTCTSGHKTVTKDYGEGIIPFVIDCTHSRCKDLAMSANYECEQTLEPTHEWYVPEKKGRGITKEVKKKFKAHGIYLREIIKTITP